MDTVISNIESKVKVYHATGATSSEIEQAELALELKFSDEYKDYLGKYGAISFGPYELTGLNIDPHVDVVEATKSERELVNFFPKDSIVIHNCGIEGLLIVQDTKGYIYEFSKDNGLKKIHDTFAGYLLELFESL